MGPLKGKVVLDLGQLIAGPSTALMLADLGAEVIKVEAPQGDQMREMGKKMPGNESVGWAVYNRNKKSIIIDMKKAEGKKVFKELIKKADIMILAYRSGVKEKLGIDYENVSKINPEIIYCNFTSFGEDGPYKNRSGVDITWQAESGLMSINGEKNGAPLRVGLTIVDLLGGHWGIQAILAALYKRLETNKGAEINISLFNVAVNMQAWQISEYRVTGQLPKRVGNSVPSSSPSGVFKTKDKDIVISAYFPKMFKKLSQAIGKPELANNPKFATNKKRLENNEELKQIMEDLLSKRSADEWLSILGEKGILCGRVQNYEEIMFDEQLKYDDIFREVTHPSIGEIPVTTSPIKSTLYAQNYEPSPRKGEHSEKILEELDFSKDEIEILKNNEVVL